MNPEHAQAPSQRRYRWPWLILAALILGIVLMVLWVLGAVRRVQQIKQSTEQNAAIAPQPPPRDSTWTNGMVWIRAGSFLMGSEEGQPDEKPVHEVSVDGFWMDKTEV